MNISHLKPKTILFSFSEVKNYVDSVINDGQKRIIVTLNTEMFVDSIYDNEFREIIDNFAVVLESVGVCHLFWKKNGVKIEPINGIDLAEKLIAEGYRVFILGARKESLDKAVQNLRSLYLGSSIVGYHHGYFEDDAVVIDQINKVSPSVLLVGMGSPKQEKWIYRNMYRLNFNIGIGIGGSIDVWSGFVRRAPELFRKAKLEWMYRIFSDFRRIPRLKKLIKFALMTTTGRI
ncbi:MAG: WecB/TagA/CpsF family glycosyltransferase [Candidatus Calescibacterium sp.]|nr:WecB/TagA/CpsF family glycosyltransferase [Candidatus Calescibacterium sp.]MDW8133281.1 WecB/TagA/CpsF family glycosyltransferase [Candidatus Calescibacterium sp.]